VTYSAPSPAPRPAAVRPHDRALAEDADAQERQRFYTFLWGDESGFAYVVGGLPGDAILARGWPLAADETANPDQVMLLTYTRDTFDAFKAAGRPHTGKVFAWPREAHALDRHVQRPAAQGYNVFTRKYLGATETAAKRGEAPATARVIVVEDAPAEPGYLAPVYSATLQTSAYSRHAFYRLPHAVPWTQVRAIAEAAGLRLGADSGGPNPAQFTRVPTTHNTKRKAQGFTVRFVPGAGAVLPAELARAVGLDLRPHTTGPTSAQDHSRSTAPHDLNLLRLPATLHALPV